MKLFSKWKAVLAFFTLTLSVGTFPAIVRAEGSDYYIYSQGNVQPVKNGDLSQIKPEYWSVWIFYDRNEGRAQEGVKCGAHDGKTASEAMEAAKKYLEFNIRWAKWLYGDSWEPNLDNCSGRKTLGPIAVMGAEVPWNRAKIPDELKEAYEQLKTARETWEQIKDVLDISNPRAGPKPENPYEHVGSVLKDYSKNLREATSLFNQVSTKLFNGGTLRGMGDVVSGLNAAMDGLRNAGQLAALELPQLNEASKPTAEARSGNCPPDATWSELARRCICLDDLYDFNEKKHACVNHFQSGGTPIQ
jgi:hypothetical protein